LLSITRISSTGWIAGIVPEHKICSWNDANRVRKQTNSWLSDPIQYGKRGKTLAFLFSSSARKSNVCLGMMQCLIQVESHINGKGSHLLTVVLTDYMKIRNSAVCHTAICAISLNAHGRRENVSFTFNFCGITYFPLWSGMKSLIINHHILSVLPDFILNYCFRMLTRRNWRERGELPSMDARMGIYRKEGSELKVKLLGMRYPHACPARVYVYNTLSCDAVINAQHSLWWAPEYLSWICWFFQCK